MPTVGPGSVMSIDVATVLTALSEVQSIDYSGGKSRTFEYTGLADTGARHLATGISDGGVIDFELMWLPADGGHQALTDEITTPTTVVANQLDGQVTFADSGTTTMPFKIAGVEIGYSITKDDGVRAPVSLQTNGVPTWAT